MFFSCSLLKCCEIIINLMFRYLPFAGLPPFPEVLVLELEDALVATNGRRNVAATEERNST